MAPQINILITGLDGSEGPAFAADGALWCVEPRGGNLIRWSRGTVERFATGGRPNGAACDGLGRIWICDRIHNAIRIFDPSSGAWQTAADRLAGLPLASPNDLAFDAEGNLLFTCPGDSKDNPTGYVCCLQPDGVIKQVASGLFFPNGLAFMDGGRKLAIAETFRERVWLGEWNAHAGEWIDPQPWAITGGPLGPDGMAAGADGLLYVAVCGVGLVKAFDAYGRVVAEHQVPGSHPTNVAFDPSGQLGLIVTEGKAGEVYSLPSLGRGEPLFAPMRPAGPAG